MRIKNIIKLLKKKKLSKASQFYSIIIEKLFKKFLKSNQYVKQKLRQMKEISSHIYENHNCFFLTIKCEQLIFIYIVITHFAKVKKHLGSQEILLKF